MKKLLILMMITLLIVAFIGCSKESSNQKTEEELRAKIKAELEAEQKAKDTENDESESLEENEVYNLSSLSNGDKVNEFIIKEIYYDSDCYSFSLQGKVTINATMEYIWNELDGESSYIVKFSEDLLKKPIKIEGDYEFMPEMLNVENYEEVNNLLSTYDIAALYDGAVATVNIDISKISSSAIFESEGYDGCEISNINSIEYDGSVTSGNNLKEYNLSQLNPGDNIEGLTISSISFEDEGVGFTLSGERTVQGKIKYGDSDFISGYYIDLNEPLLNKPIVTELPSGEKVELNFYSMEISNPEKLESLISKEQIEYINAVPANEYQDGNELQVEVVLKDFTFTGFYESEMFQDCEIIDVLSIESN